jgi:putative addiction module component (TIGR02574 family)
MVEYSHERVFGMATLAAKVLDDVLSLPSDARIGLVDSILSSLNLPTQPAIDKLWAQEAERRVAQIDQGKVTLIPGEKVFARIRQKYRP